MLMRELITALDNGDRRLALDKLERFGEFRRRFDFVRHLRRQLYDDITVAAMRRTLAANDFKAAIEVVNRAINTEGISARLVQERNKVVGLLKIDRYREAAPYHDAETAQAAVAALPSPTLMGTHSEVYLLWHDDQSEHVRQLVEEENIQLINELLYEMDVALATGSELFPLHLAQLGASLSELDVDDHWLKLITGNIDLDTVTPEAAVDPQLPRTIREFPFLSSGYDSRTFDFAVYNRYDTSDRKSRDQYGIFLGERPPATFTGTLLRARDAFAKDDYRSGFLQTARLNRMFQTDVPPALHGAIDRAYFGSNRRGAAPTAGNVLNHIYTLLESN